ncbi:4793_t:CDS:2 [Funneliformis mosseae]|uniref:4793_t:CDS:1 n=1 Tax=Funneliformis mosseae TaxID=27381 RepID=A0A9N8VU28_FUNMO|nr:4793_t:CDS:2 [Funneliformis mosseae]
MKRKSAGMAERKYHRIYLCPTEDLSGLPWLLRHTLHNLRIIYFPLRNPSLFEFHVWNSYDIPHPLSTSDKDKLIFSVDQYFRLYEDQIETFIEAQFIFKIGYPFHEQ